MSKTGLPVVCRTETVASDKAAPDRPFQRATSPMAVGTSGNVSG